MQYTILNIPPASIRASLVSPLAVVSTPSEDASSSALFGAFSNAEPVSVTSSLDGCGKTPVSIPLHISAMSRLQDHRNVTAMVMNVSSSGLRRDLNFSTPFDFHDQCIPDCRNSFILHTAVHFVYLIHLRVRQSGSLLIPTSFLETLTLPHFSISKINAYLIALPGYQLQPTI